MLHRRPAGGSATAALHPVLMTAVAAAIGGLSTAATAQSTPLDLGLYNTGVDDSGNLLADGAPDPHYSAAVVGEAGGSAFVLEGTEAIGPWIANGPDEKWIGPTPNFTQPPNTHFLYETSFDWSGMSADERGRTVVYGQYAADDSLVGLQINGQSQGYSGGNFATYRPFAVSGNAAGVNTLDFTVSNGAGGNPPADNPHGFRARFTTVAVSSDVTQTFASESFDYGVGTLTGNNGGTGFNGGWGHRQDLDSAVVTQPGLDDIGAVDGVIASGNKATSGTTSLSSQSFRAFDLASLPAELKDADGNIGNPGSSLWMSVLMERQSDQPVPFFGISTFLVDNPELIGTGAFDPAAAGLNEQIFVGVGSQDTQWKIQGNGSAQRTGITPDDASTEGADLLVVRIDFLDDGVDDDDRLPDAAYLWVNPDEDSLATPNIADADGRMVGFNASNGVFENLHFNALRVTGAGEAHIDEFRMGSDFASVVVIPEPATVGLLGTAGLLALRRRRA